MKQAIIINGIVSSIILANDDFANSLSELTINVSDIVEIGVGWKHNLDNTFSHPDTLMSLEDLLTKKTAEEKAWRDSELNLTDKLANIKDYPYYYATISYRENLRNYPTSVDFPNGVRPILDKTIKNSLTKYQFMSRFTAEERIAITTASTQSPELADWMELFKLTEEMNLNDPQTIAGVQMLEAGGIIGVGRANEILS